MIDVLEHLKTKMIENASIIETARLTINRTEAENRELMAAITAIENERSAVAKENGAARPRKRGDLKKSILDCIRDGIGRVGDIQSELLKRGIAVKRANISNCLSRLQEQHLISAPPALNGRWVAKDRSENAEGSRVDLEPPRMNGTAGTYYGHAASENP